MALSNAGKHLMLNGFAAAAVYQSLHTADPTTVGNLEVVGGSPAYARKLIDWAVAASGALTNEVTPLVFDIPAGTTVAWAGYWSALSGGTYYGARQLTSETYAGQGTYTVAVGEIDETVA